MRLLVTLLLILAPNAAGALETARALAGAGAARLALTRVEALQPREVNAPRWPEWEALRMNLLVAAGRNEEALRRADALPLAMPARELRACLLSAASAAIASGDGAAARRYLARVVWQLEPAREELRAARLLVIESYLAERQGQTAFLAMLRFQQDYAPLESADAGRFVAGLLALDMDRQAVNWLAALDEASPARLMLRLRTGLIEPAAAVAQARARLAKGGATAFWNVLVEAARRQENSALRVEGLERLLNADQPTGAGAAQPAAAAVEMWEAYATAAADAANRNKLLAGEDAAWADFAGRQLAVAPPVARAIYAHLATRARDARARMAAQGQLVTSLQQAGLERAALRLFDVLRIEDDSLDAEARRLLGAMAERARQPALTVRYWSGLAAPAGMSAEEWQARLAAANWRAGREDAALEALRGLAEKAKPLPAEAARMLAEAAREMVAAGKTVHAEEALRVQLAGAATKQQREALYSLGQVAEQSARALVAAGYYLRSALLDEGKVPDALALRARLAAGRSLAQAGYLEDARAQFQWLVKNAKDPAQADIARRELAKL